MTTYGYLRVSTIDQNTEKNKFDVLKFANEKKLGNVEFVEEQISGKSNFKNRQLGILLEKMEQGDILIVPELSRIARSITQIFEVIDITKQKEITLYSIKENFSSNDKSITSTVTTTIFALVAQIERDLISLRTKEALQVKKASGIKLGRPKGKGKSKLDQYKDEIMQLVELHVPKTIIAKKGKETLGVSDQALAYLYKDLDTIQIQYPISHGQILHSIEPLVQKGLNELHAFDGLLRPSVLVSVPTELSQRQRELWQQMFLDCGIRKVEFISNLNALQEEGSCFLVHSGHSYTEIHVCAYGKVLVSKTIYYAGAQIDEQIQRIVYNKTGCFITKMDAAHLKEMASLAFWQQKNNLLLCYAFDSRQILHQIQIESSLLWPAFEMVSAQISLWVKHCFDGLPASLQEHFLMHGIELSGGLADCFGPSQFISKNISCPVLCTKRGQYDMIDALKGVKSA